MWLSTPSRIARGLFHPPNAPPAKPNTRVIYELSASGEIKFRDDCTYELRDDDTYSSQAVDVHNGTVNFNEYNPNHQDLSLVKLRLEEDRNLHVVVTGPRIRLFTWRARFFIPTANYHRYHVLLRRNVGPCSDGLISGTAHSLASGRHSSASMTHRFL